MSYGVQPHCQSILDTLESAQKHSIVPDQEFYLQGSVLDSSVNFLLERLRGLCDGADRLPEEFHDRETVFGLKDFGAIPTAPGPLSQGVTLKVRKCLKTNNWVLRYTGQPELGNPYALLRNCLDIPVSSNICEFLKELGAKIDYEYIAKGFILKKGRIKCTVYKIYKLPAVDKPEPFLNSNIVELSVVTTPTDDGVAEELKLFADQLKPLALLEKTGIGGRRN